MAFWKGSRGGDQEDRRKKEEGCVQDPEEEKQLDLAEGSVKVKSTQDSNKPQAGAAAHLGLPGWAMGDGVGVAVTRTWLCHASSSRGCGTEEPLEHAGWAEGQEWWPGRASKQ